MPYLIDILQIAPKLNNTFLLNLNLSKAPFSEERHLAFVPIVFRVGLTSCAMLTVI